MAHSLEMMHCLSFHREKIGLCSLMVLGMVDRNGCLVWFIGNNSVWYGLSGMA